MKRICCFGFACVVGLLGLASAVIALATNYWFLVETSTDNTTAIDVVSMYQYPYRVGIWLTCYEDKIPDSVNPEKLISGQCVLDYDFQLQRTEDFARTSAVSLVLACGIMFVASIMGLTGCICRRSTPILISGLFTYVSGICTLVAMCSFIGRIVTGQSDLKPYDNISTKFGWSFFLGWVSLALQVVSASLLVGGAKGCGSTMKSGNNFA
nr:claudin domain-containing protein 1 [Ciona intestinalis]|eukprot:XP_002119328.1 claudin domain-containing protein 1 [Ciona intestinalis]